MRLFCIIASILMALPALCAQDELTVFPSRDKQVELINTEGVALGAVINDVWPERQSTRIFVPAQGSSFTLEMATFDDNSQAVIQDWFYKRLANQNLSFKVDERLIGRLQQSRNREGLPQPETGALNVRVSDQVREKDISVEIRNSSNYIQKDLEVTIGMRVVREITDSVTGGKSRMERNVKSVHRAVQVPSGGSVTVNSAPVALSNYTLRYDLIIPLTINNGMTDQTIRRRAQASDRIVAYYVLVRYKGELVAETVSQRYMVRWLLEQEQEKLRKQQRGETAVEVLDEPFIYGRGGSNTFDENINLRPSVIITN